VVEWVQEAVALGAGEVLLASVDRDGTRQGYDLELIRAVSPGLSVPLVACGGCGRPEDAVEAVRAGADAVALSSLLHYEAVEDVTALGALSEGNTEFLRGRRGPPPTGASIPAIKDALSRAGYAVRG
jgi:cyclase